MDELRLTDRRFMAVFISLFTVALGFGVILPVLPFYVERLALGTKASAESITFHIGLLTSTYPFFQMLFAPLWGQWSDRFGRRPFFIAGLCGFVLMQLLIGSSTSLWMLYFARIIGGVFTSAIIPVGYALITDLTSKKNRTSGIAWAGVSYSLGVVGGPVIGALLSRTDFHLDLGHYTIDDYSVPFFFLVAIGLVTIVIVTRWLRNNGSGAVESSDKKPSSRWRQIAWNLFPFLFLSFLYQAVLTLFESVFSIYSKNELQYDAATIGYGLMICAFVMSLLQPVAGSQKLKKRLSGLDQIIWGFGVFGLSIILLSIANRISFVLIAIGLLATGAAFIIPNITSAITLKGNPAAGEALGIQNAVNSFGQVIGPIAGSWLLTINKSLPYLLAGLTLILTAGFLLKKRSAFRQILTT